MRAELYNDIPMKDLGVVRKVPIHGEEGIHPVFKAVLPETYTVDIIWDEEVSSHHHSVYNKKDDDTSKEIQEILVKQQDIFMRMMR